MSFVVSFEKGRSLEGFQERGVVWFVLLGFFDKGYVHRFSFFIFLNINFC